MRENCPLLKRGLCQRCVPSTTWTRLHVKVMYSTLNSMMQKPKKRVRERKTLPLISWTVEKHVKALTNKQLKMYLKQKGLKISGSKTELIDRVLTHARGNLSARDAVEDEESPSSCEDDTSSESSDSDDSSNDSLTYIEESFEVMFVPEEELQQVN